MDARIAILFAVLSGVLFAFLTPVSALFLESAPPVFTVAVLNLGAGIGMLLFLLFSRKSRIAKTSQNVQKKDIPVLIFIIIGDLLGALLSMLSLLYASADSVSLMLNFEIVSTALIALCFFREKVSRRLWVAITLITLGCITVTSGNLEQFIASPGVFMALGSCVCWGITHNLYKKVSYQNPHGILTIRGLGIGIIALIISLIIGEGTPELSLIPIILILGFVTYGLGNIFFVLSQRRIGAPMVSAICGFSPFLAAIISLVIFHESPSLTFIISFLLLVPGVWIAVTECLDSKEPSLPATDNTVPKQHHDIRNSLSAIGFFIIAGYFLLFGLAIVDYLFLEKNLLTVQINLGLCCSFFLAVIGTILIILRKRDFIGITFIAYATLLGFFSAIGQNCYLSIFLGILAFILAGIFFLANDRKKIIMIILFVIQGLFFIMAGIFSERFTPFIISFVLAGFLFFIGIISSSLIPKFKLTDVLISDESTDFRQNGTMIGYLVFALSISPWLVTYLFGSDSFSTYPTANATIVCVFAMTLISVLMIFVGKSWFTGAMFLGVSFTLVLGIISSGSLFYVIGVSLLILGLLAAIRKPPFLLMALMFIIYGISAISSFVAVGSMTMIFVQILLNLIPCLIAVYLAAATFSQKWKLPLF